MYVYGENRLRTSRSGGNSKLVSTAGHQAVGVGVSNRTLDGRFVRTVAQQFRYRLFQSRHGAQGKSPADAQSRDAEALEFGNGRGAGNRKQVERSFKRGYESLDVGAVADRRDEQAIGAGLAISIGAADGMLETGLG